MAAHARRGLLALASAFSLVAGFGAASADVAHADAAHALAGSAAASMSVSQSVPFAAASLKGGVPGIATDVDPTVSLKDSVAEAIGAASQAGAQAGAQASAAIKVSAVAGNIATSALAQMAVAAQASRQCVMLTSTTPQKSQSATGASKTAGSAATGATGAAKGTSKSLNEAMPLKEFLAYVPSTDWQTALTDRSDDVGVPSEGYTDSPYTFEKTYNVAANIWVPDADSRVGGTVYVNRKVWQAEQYWDGKKPFRITSGPGRYGTIDFQTYNDFLLEDGVAPNGALKIDNIGLERTGGSENIFARGNKLVIGENVVTEEGETWRINGGTEHNDDIGCAEGTCGRPNIPTNVIVGSGHWHGVWGGGEGATGKGTQLTIRGNALVDAAYGGGHRKGSVGVNEPMVNGTRANPNNSGIKVYIEDNAIIGTLYGGSAIDGKGLLTGEHPLVINEDILIDVTGGYVGRIFGGSDTHDDGRGNPVIYSTIAESPINGDVYINLSAPSATAQVVGDINRNVPRAATEVRQVQGATILNVTADQTFNRMELLDFVNIDGATVTMADQMGFGVFDAEYPAAGGYLGNVKVTNGGRLELANGRGVINERYAHYNNSGSWQANYTEPDRSLKASANHSAIMLRHGWTGETSEANRANSVLAINGQAAGITAASGTAFNDNRDVAGLLIHGSVGGDTGWDMQGGAGSPGYSTLEVLGTPIYSDSTNYYYYVVADGSASNRVGTISKVPTSVNGGAAFKEPEGADYVVLYRELADGKIGWYLREKPQVTMNNQLLHVGDSAPVTAHVDMNGFAYEWAANQNNRIKIAVTKHAGATNVTDTDLTISATDLAGIASNPRFTNVTYDADGNLTGFDVVIDESPATEPAFYELSMEFEGGDDNRVGTTANCARAVYDFVKASDDTSAADYQDSIMTTSYSKDPAATPAAPAGADMARLVVQLPYGVNAGSLTIGEDDGAFALTSEADGSGKVASLTSVAAVAQNWAGADPATSDSNFAVSIGGDDLSDGVTVTNVAGVAAYDGSSGLVVWVVDLSGVEEGSDFVVGAVAEAEANAA